MAPNNKTLGHVAIIGGCGFVGFNIVNLILERYPESKIAVLDVRTDVNRLDNSSVSYNQCDITDFSALKELFGKLKLDTVIHTAALIPMADSANSRKISYKVNVDGTKNLLAVSQETGVKAFVFTSSSSVVVGDVWEVINADESWPVLVGKDQPEYYSTTKAMAEIAVLEANRSSSSSLLTCALRPAGIFGDHDNTSLLRTLQIRGAKMCFQIGNGENLFDFTYVKNVAHAHLLAAEALLQTHTLGITPLDSERVDGEAFFITNGEPVYFWDFIRRIWILRGMPEDKTFDLSKVWVISITVGMFFATLSELIMGLLGRTANFNRLSIKASAMTRYFNIDKARMRLKYEPLFGLDEGVQRGVRQMVSQESTSEKKG
ncbi:C-3 sterol dehydrogenase/C-4 decarboxylase-like protein [Microthyrium microscopicum]|uniref:C-3 sterol dehydrogenase/C-4 decarboxylase-like protein n=1 Tax=Microthyrium microscopicum TaxID=703497 RepID=A0A6A6USV3_9PEZI|nr:C-3 sterol dehydrogenase/C-4 decarboxylase-like protein [Microthyrium microscopicum]